MKALKALFLLFFFLCNGFFSLSAQDDNSNMEVIVLDSYPIKDKDESGSKGEKGTPIKRSPRQRLAHAYLYNNVVSVNINRTIAVINVTITNESTGETVSSETYCNPTYFDIDLSSEDNGNYLIRIETENIFLQSFLCSPYFSIQNKYC